LVFNSVVLVVEIQADPAQLGFVCFLENELIKPAQFEITPQKSKF